MTKQAKVILIVTLILVLSLSLVACKNDGKSAYEIAVENGFEGSETEWLESLHGKDGVDGTNGNNGQDGASMNSEEVYKLYQVAVEKEGYKGSFVDFIKTLGLSPEGVISTSDSLAAANKAIRSIVDIKSYNQSGTNTLTGSGVIVEIDKEKGNMTIVTNYHVICFSNKEISTNINIRLFGNEEIDKSIAMKAKYFGGSEYYDLAVLKVEGAEEVKSSKAIKAEFSKDPIIAGQTAIAIGNQKSKGISVNNGVICKDSVVISIKSATNITRDMRLLRMDCLINSGNSGGGLFDNKGNLIGIVNAKGTGEMAGNNYAIPKDVVEAVVDNILDTCNERENRLFEGKKGVSLVVESSGLRSVTVGDNVLYVPSQIIKVTDVHVGGIAEGKLQVGDILDRVVINGKTIVIDRDFSMDIVMLHARENAEMKVTVIRNGEFVEETLKFENSHLELSDAILH